LVTGIYQHHLPPLQSKINLELTYSAPNRAKESIREESIKDEGGEGDSEEEGQGI